jgi:Na+/proline symporter
MSAGAILCVLGAYFGVLLLFSYLTGRKNAGNAAFFLGNRQSPWVAVGVGMVGASLSGVTFVSVPGMVMGADFTYIQMVMGFMAGYAAIAFVLLPLYYKWRVTSIYMYLGRQIGSRAYRTGAGFFLAARTILASVRLYLAVFILQTYVFDAWGVPFAVTAAGFLLMIWAYTHRSGVRTLVWTDVLQTMILLIALIVIIVQVVQGLGLNFWGAAASIGESSHFRIFVFDDWQTRQNFVKQFISGALITIAMTGVDQEMMQKTLSCRNLREAQKNVGLCSLFFIPLNFLFLCLGVLLLNYLSQKGLPMPAQSDSLLPDLVSGGYLGSAAILFFTTGIIAVTFAGADSALTGLTTSICVDFLNVQRRGERRARQIRGLVHGGLSLTFILIMLLFRAINSTNVLDAIYTIASYLYGPLLGLFACAIFFKRTKGDRAAPYVCLLAPLICFGISCLLKSVWDYRLGYELLLINALLVVLGMRIFPSNGQKSCKYFRPQ